MSGKRSGSRSHPVWTLTSARGGTRKHPPVGRIRPAVWRGRTRVLRRDGRTLGHPVMHSLQIIHMGRRQQETRGSSRDRGVVRSKSLVHRISADWACYREHLFSCWESRHFRVINDGNRILTSVRNPTRVFSDFPPFDPLIHRVSSRTALLDIPIVVYADGFGVLVVFKTVQKSETKTSWNIHRGRLQTDYREKVKPKSILGWFLIHSGSNSCRSAEKSKISDRLSRFLREIASLWVN